MVHDELRSADKWKLTVVTIDAYLAQRILLSFRINCGCVEQVQRYCDACCGGCCTRRRGVPGARGSDPKPPAGAAGPSGATTIVRRRGGGAATPNESGSSLLSGASTDAGSGVGGSDSTVVAFDNPMKAKDGEAGGGGESKGTLHETGSSFRARLAARHRKSISKLSAMMDMSEDEMRSQTDMESRRARRLQSDMAQLAVWRKEWEFMTAVAVLYHQGKRQKGFDLYAYLERFTDSTGWDNSYISVHEASPQQGGGRVVGYPFVHIHNTRPPSPPPPPSACAAVRPDQPDPLQAG